LISFYLMAVLKAKNRALGFAALLAALYGALYAILQLEDVALLIGACLLFVLLAVVMALTRNVDWYGWRAPPTLDNAS
jgi:inner membrane protein